MKIGINSLFSVALACLTAISACNDSSGKNDKIGEDICKDGSYDPMCEEACVGSVDCGANLYCDPIDKICRADCTPEGDECGDEGVCIDHGRCMESCAGVVVDLSLLVPTVMLVIDQSGSMSENFGNTNRWDAVETALADAQQGVVPALQEEIRFGASLYTSHSGFGGGTCPVLQNVLPKMMNAGPIADLFNANSPDGDTPTGESLIAVTDLLKDLPVDPDNPGGATLIVLATDGEPDTCAEPNPQNGQDDSIAGAQYAFSHAVRVVVLSVGRDVSGPHLQDLANAGAGLPIDGPDNAPYYVADDPEALLASFDEIVQGARGCIFALDGSVEPIEYAAYGQVELNGQALVHDDPDGWRLNDPSTLELLGEACEAFLGSDQVSLSATFPCGAIATD
jgi:hypothetical protein